MRSILLIVVPIILTTSSCKKTITETVTVTIRDTVTLHHTDTLEVLALDTNITMTAAHWTAFSYATNAIVDSGISTFKTVPEGIRFQGQQPRLGLRLQTKSEFGFRGKNVYMKWKANGNTFFAALVPQLKYDPFSIDAVPFVQGIDLAKYSLRNVWDSSTLLQSDTWYYTRFVPVPGTDNYRIITSTGDYHHQGGTIVAETTTPIYTKSGYLALRIGDPFGGSNAYVILAECRINGK